MQSVFHPCPSVAKKYTNANSGSHATDLFSDGTQILRSRNSPRNDDTVVLIYGSKYRKWQFGVLRATDLFSDGTQILRSPRLPQNDIMSPLRFLL
jgi:hypothetical protein